MDTWHNSWLRFLLLSAILLLVLSQTCEVSQAEAKPRGSNPAGQGQIHGLGPVYPGGGMGMRAGVKAKVVKAAKANPKTSVKATGKKVRKAPNKSPVPAKAPAKKPPKPQKPITPKVVCLKNPAVPAGKLDITERICQAKKILAMQHADAGYCTKEVQVCKWKGKGKARQRTCNAKKVQYFCRHNILLAAMDETSGEIKIVKVDASTGRSETTGYSVLQRTHDGVDSEYDVHSPPGKLVIGMQFAVQLRTARGIVIERALYTPYTRELRAAYPELVTLGWNYLQEGLNTAREKIEKSGVSLDDIDPRVIFALVMVEHFTNEELSDAEVEEEMYRVALTIGANGGAAYKYSVSKTGARGIGQFMPQTWNSLRGRYPNLLTKEFFAGSAEHSQAFLAQYLLSVEDLKYLFNQRDWRQPPRAWAFLADPRGVGEYLALAYNGGAPRAHRWVNSDRRMTLPAEGTKYVAKFSQVWRVLERLSSE